MPVKGIIRQKFNQGVLSCPKGLIKSLKTRVGLFKILATPLIGNSRESIFDYEYFRECEAKIKKRFQQLCKGPKPNRFKKNACPFKYSNIDEAS